MMAEMLEMIGDRENEDDSDEGKQGKDKELPKMLQALCTLSS